MNRYVIVDSHGQVQNIILWDGVARFDPPDGCTLEPSTPELEAQWAAQQPTSPSP